MHNVHHAYVPAETADIANGSDFTLSRVLFFVRCGVMVCSLVPRMCRPQVCSNIGSTKVAVHSVEQALKFYSLHHDGRFPTEEEGLLALVEQPVGDNLWHGPYLESSGPPTDAWGSPLEYRLLQSNGTPEIRSIGSDRQSGTADDITN
jgi:general secretion pathway protein G